MKRFIIPLLLIALTACSKDGERSPEQEGSGTRGGGDACEIDYRSHLISAFHWLTSQEGQSTMTSPEKAKIASLPKDFTDRIAVSCSTDPIVLDGIRKTALSESLADGRYTTRVDPNLWFTAPSATRRGLAAHEVLILLGIEQTGDYHISAFLKDLDIFATVEKLECRKTIWENHEFLLELQGSNFENFAEIRYSAVVTFKVGSLAKTTRLELSKSLSCMFSDTQDYLFTCYEQLRSGVGGSHPALEIVNSGMGIELRMYWENLREPSIDLAGAQRALSEYAPISIGRMVPGALSIALGSASFEYALDDPRATRCQLLKRD